MWEKITRLKFCVLFFAGWLFFVPLCFAAPAPGETPGTVTMSTAQWEELKQIMAEQDELLTTLQSLSTEDSESLNQLINGLKTARQSLRKAESELTAAKQSLKIADETLIEQNKSLALLSEQIKKERAVSNRRQLQHTFWGIIFGLAVGATVNH